MKLPNLFCEKPKFWLWRVSGDSWPVVGSTFDSEAAHQPHLAPHPHPRARLRRQGRRKLIWHRVEVLVWSASRAFPSFRPSAGIGSLPPHPHLFPSCRYWAHSSGFKVFYICFLCFVWALNISQKQLNTTAAGRISSQNNYHMMVSFPKYPQTSLFHWQFESSCPALNVSNLD